VIVRPVEVAGQEDMQPQPYTGLVIVQHDLVQNVVVLAEAQ
jgi:hypothetical protein